MKNLKLNCVTSGRVPLDKDIVTVTSTFEENAEIIICDYNLNVCKYDFQNNLKWNTNLNSIISDKSVCPVSAHYISLKREVVFALDNGDIVTVECDDLKMKVEASLPENLMCMSCSPDEELFVAVTKDLKMYMLSTLYDVIDSVNLISDEFGEGAFVTVGWGKKETQFHGSEGKQAAKKTVEDIIVEKGSIDTKPIITWRGDGQLFAIGYLEQEQRKFKVFDRECVLQFTSENQPGLFGLLAWKPTGSLIATVQKLPNKLVVAFFEKNGLKHGDFALPIDYNSEIRTLCWSTDSEILAVHTYDTNTHLTKILLYTCNNYHWYLKQCITFTQEQKVHSLIWDGSLNTKLIKQLNIFLSNGEHISYNWHWSVDHSQGIDERDDSVVSVIDGNKILLTAFRHSVVPPPMSGTCVELDTHIRHIMFAPKQLSNNVNNFIAVTDKLTHFKQVCKQPLIYESDHRWHINTLKYYSSDYLWAWINNETFINIFEYCGEYFLNEHKIDSAPESGVINLMNKIKIVSSVFNCKKHPITDEFFIQMHDGSIYKYLNGTLESHPVKFPQACHRFEIINVGKELCFIGLTMKNRLYINGVEYIKDINSIFVHNQSLLLTTLQHKLLITKLNKVGLEYLKTLNIDSNTGVSKRNVERGSKLVLAVQEGTRTVLQMPRGNLEVIQPRALSLDIIGKYLEEYKYYNAFDLMRKQRINLNLIYDHNPDNFMSNIDKFVMSITNDSWLNLFLADLENTDVTKTMYSSSYVGKNINETSSNKINMICDAVRSQLYKDGGNRILPILTTYLKKNSIPELENALLIIKKLKELEMKGEKPSVSSDEALKFVLYMIDVNKIFDIALGMYDFELVLLVASKSQKDPKEYLQMLNEFNVMDEDYKKFSINKHLKRYARATHFLVKCSPNRNDELRSFVKYHGLYSTALGLLKPDDEIYKLISEDYALNLKLNKHFYEAGIIYNRGGHLDKAIECFREIDWETALSLANQWPRDKIDKLCRELIDRLNFEKCHESILLILEHYCKDYNEAIKYALSCGRFLTAMRCFNMYFDRRNDLRSDIHNVIVDEYNNLLKRISTNGETFTKYCDRLKVVRENKTKAASTQFDDYDCYNPDSDLYSDAGSTIASNTSKSSSRSYRSSKNKRKHERKLVSLKEGSQYEDIALVVALYNIITSSYDLRTSVYEATKAMCQLNDVDIPLNLQDSLDTLLKSMKASFKEIWSNEFMLEAVNAAIEAADNPEGVSAVPQGLAALELHFRMPPVLHDVKWKLEGF